MKVVVFAHTPPPHHGQSYMVELMLRGFADPKYGIECFHVNARFSSGTNDLSRFRLGKVFALFGYCAQALKLRFQHGAPNLYYVPTPPLRVPLFRDWLILAILRPFFKRTFFHWHAAGLGEWLENQPAWMKSISMLILGRPDMSVSLGKFNESDAARLDPKESSIVPNGIPDPCKNFTDVAKARCERITRRDSTPVKVLFLGLGIKEKGFADAMRGVFHANESCQTEGNPLRFELEIAGSFLGPENERLFAETMRELKEPKEIRHIGFVAGDEKAKALALADILCFPTYYFAESFGLVIIEAMAFGLPIVSTRWRSIPDLFPENYPGLVEIQSPEKIARALISLARRDDSEEFRQRFLEKFTVERHLEQLAAAFRKMDCSPSPAPRS